MTLRVLIVDDEALARARLRTLLEDCGTQSVEVLAEASQVDEAMVHLTASKVDLLLLDIGMPGIDGLTFARSLRNGAHPPAIVFVTAHAAHAVTAFELDAVDYLTKPVRAERLQQALQKAERHLKDRHVADAAPDAPEVLLIHDRGRAERVPFAEVLYLKSEYKYLTVRTASRSHILDGSLSEFEERYPARFVRVHRNALVARAAIRALVRHDDGEDAEGWALRLEGIPEPVAVSRRQLATVREALKDPQ